MIKVFGKGDTVANSEYWDKRDTYNGLTQYLEYGDNTLAIKNIFNDNIEMLSLLESINVDKFWAGGVMQTSFSNEFDMTTDDYVSLTINNITRHYARCTPGIASFNGYANCNKPATELCVQELNKILDIQASEVDNEFIDIKFSYVTDTFKGKIHKIVNDHMEIYEYTNGTDYDDDTALGYPTGVELLHAMYTTPSLTKMFEDAIGDDLTKIDLERTVEVTETGVYYWALNSVGIINLVTDHAGHFKINQFEITDLDLDISGIDNTHVYSAETELFNGDLIVGGNLTVNGTQIIANTETVLIEDNILIINNLGDNLSDVSGVTAGSAGISVDRGLLPDYQFIFDEATDSFMIGEEGSLQTVATREATPTNKGIAFWDGTNLLMKTEAGFEYDDVTDTITVPSATFSVLVTVEDLTVNGTFTIDSINVADITTDNLTVNTQSTFKGKTIYSKTADEDNHFEIEYNSTTKSLDFIFV